MTNSVRLPGRAMQGGAEPTVLRDPAGLGSPSEFLTIWHLDIRSQRSAVFITLSCELDLKGAIMTYKQMGKLRLGARSWWDQN